MWISNFSIKNPVITSVVMMALVVFGIVSLLLLDTDEFPEVEPPVVTLSIAYPGAGPETVELELIDPIEEAVASISGVDTIRSTALDGFASIVVEFTFEKDLNQATQDIRDGISEIRSELPPEIEEPVLTRFDPQDLPIVSLTLSSPDWSPAELTRLADPGITSVLRGLGGVAEVKLVGGVERELTVELDPRALSAAGIGVAEVVTALQGQNLAVPVGRLTDDLEERTIRLRGRLSDVTEFERMSVGKAGDRVVRLAEVARVRDGVEEARSAALFDGRPAVGVDVVKATGYSTTEVSDRVRGRVEELQRSMPPGVDLRVVRDAGVRVGQSVRDVEISLLEGAVLTVLVVFLFLNSWRSTVITGLALPVSVLASFIAVLAFGFTLNTMSLLGLSLAIGILIDDAIVVRENIVRHMEMGKDHVTAAREGTAEIGLAVAATTFSIVVVFLPIAFMGGVAEQWFAPFALTLAMSVLVSLLVSFSLDPMLSAAWPDPRTEGKRRFLSRQVARFNDWFDRRTGQYKRLVRWALDHRLSVAAIALASFVVSLLMPVTGLVGSEFFPEEDRSEFSVTLETPPGSNLEYTRIKVQEASRLAAQEDGVAYTYATIGGITGEEVDEASIYVRLVPKDERSRNQAELATDLRERVSRLSGVTASLVTGGFSTEKQIQVEVIGPDLEVLSGLAERVEREVRGVEGAVDVGLSTRGQKPELEVELDRSLAAELGITAAEAALAMRPAFAGVDTGDWVDPSGETRDVTVRLEPKFRTKRADLESLPLTVRGKDGTPHIVPLGQVARVREREGPNLVSRLNRERVVIVEANTAGKPLSAVVGGIEERLNDLALPLGYRVQQGGETEEQVEVFGRILVALGIAVLLMYVILVIQFRSFLDPISIMASLPLSLIGVMLALFVTGSTLNIMSMIGVILLMGIVAKNAILLIDFAKWTTEAGTDRKQAIVDAGGVRLRPILMTSLAIVAGMLPVAVGAGEGAEFRAPLGRAVIGGVITSTLLTLLVIPTLYDTLSSARDHASSWLVRRRRGSGRPRGHAREVMPEGEGSHGAKPAT